MNEVLYFVIPCYNEEEVLPISSAAIRDKLRELIEAKGISPQSRIVFVDDGSADRTWRLIEDLHKSDPVYQGIRLSRNRGHQNALLAGLMTVRNKCDITISMDADLQDDVNAADGMIDAYRDGAQVVYGVRSARDTDTFFKRFTAEAFYKFMKTLGANVVFNHADYRLMSRTALEGLSEFEESNIFLRGIVPMVGYKTDTVYYKRGKRQAGESKYPLKKMFSFAWEGVTSLSAKPIRWITLLGFVIFVISIGMLIYSLIRHFTGATQIGWTSIMVSVWALGGLQLLAIGIIGEYIGKTYIESKRRPKYLIETYLNDDETAPSTQNQHIKEDPDEKHHT